MEVPFEYLCLLALERLSKYENIRHIKIETLSKYIECIKKEFMISFNSGEPAYNEKGIKRNFKFESFDFDEKLNDLLNDYGDIVYLDGNNLVLDDSIDYDMLEGILDEFNVSTRFKIVFFNDSCRKILDINTILGTLMSYSLFESQLQEKYIKLPFSTDRKKALSELKSLMIFRELFLNKLKSLSRSELECYYDESNEFINMSQDDYIDYPINLNFWYQSMYYDSDEPREIDDILYDIYLYSLFSKNDISSVKIGMEISKIYSGSLDTSEDVDYFFKEFLDQIPDIDSDNFLDNDVSDEFIDDDSGIIVTDEKLDYLFYLTLIKKIDEFVLKYGGSSELIVKRQRLLYSLDNSSLCLYEDGNIDNMLEELKEQADDFRLPFYRTIIYFLTEEVFNNKMDNNTIIKLLLISSYYEITNDEKIKMLFSKNANNRYYDLFERIVFKDEKTLSLG